MKVLARIRSLVPKKFERKHVLILIVLGIATFLRFYNVANTVQFLGDQGRDALIVSRIFRELDFVFIGGEYVSRAVVLLLYGPFSLVDLSKSNGTCLCNCTVRSCDGVLDVSFGKEIFK